MKLMIMTDIYIVLKNDETQEILIAERYKRNELNSKYNRGVFNIGVIDNCLGVTAVGLGVTEVSFSQQLQHQP